MRNFNDIAAVIRGVSKTTAFLLITLFLLPVALVYKRLKPEDPFKIPRLFHSIVLRLLGITVQVQGTPSTAAPVLFISNHVSYLDITVLGSLLSAGFVAKAEVLSWPLFGLLARIQNTVFIERRTTRVAEQSALIQNYLEKKRNLVLFPEGTSSDGLTVLPFKSSLFSIIENHSENNKPLTVQPLSITCVKFNGLPMLREERAKYAWYGDMTLIPHLWNVFKHGAFVVDVIFHDPLSIPNGANRKDFSTTIQRIVEKGVSLSLAKHDILPS